MSNPKTNKKVFSEISELIQSNEFKEEFKGDVKESKKFKKSKLYNDLNKTFEKLKREGDNLNKNIKSKEIKIKVKKNELKFLNKINNEFDEMEKEIKGIPNPHPSEKDKLFALMGKLKLPEKQKKSNMES